MNSNPAFQSNLGKCLDSVVATFELRREAWQCRRSIRICIVACFRPSTNLYLLQKHLHHLS